MHDQTKLTITFTVSVKHSQDTVPELLHVQIVEIWTPAGWDRHRFEELRRGYGVEVFGYEPECAQISYREIAQRMQQYLKRQPFHRWMS